MRFRFGVSDSLLLITFICLLSFEHWLTETYKIRVDIGVPGYLIEYDPLIIKILSPIHLLIFAVTLYLFLTCGKRALWYGVLALAFVDLAAGALLFLFHSYSI